MSLKNLLRRFKFDHNHDETSITEIEKEELASANIVRNLKAVGPVRFTPPSKNTGAANAVSKQLAELQDAMTNLGTATAEDDTYDTDKWETETEGYANAVEFDSKSPGGATRRSRKSRDE